MINKFKPKSEFSKNILTLMTGASLAQAIPILISPILTRLYTPEDFGIFALFSAIVLLLSILSAGRYESAIVLPKLDKEAKNILGLSILISSLFSIILIVIIYIFFDSIINLSSFSEIGIYLYLIPIAVFLTTLYQVFYNFLNREKAYNTMSISKVLQTSTTGITNIILGIKELQYKGLIIGQVFGQFVITIYLFIYIRPKISLKDLELELMTEQMKKHINFPKFDIFSAFFNTLSLQLPILMLGFLFSPAIVGLFAFSRRIIGLPIIVLSSSITTVFKQRATSDYNKDGNCVSIYKKTLYSLIKIAIIPSIVLFCIAPDLFSFIFGENWKEAGIFTQVLAPMFFLRFISGPLSYLFYICNKQKLNMIVQIILLVLISLSLYIGYLLNDIYIALILFSSSFSIIYLFYLYKSYELSKGVTNDTLFKEK